MGCLNGLDLFSGIGGLTIALQDWVRPVAYCEIDRYAQHVLLSRMSEGELPIAPIWDDVQTLKKEHLPLPIDIIYGGFPCQDISVAGRGEGLEGERSGLFFEIVRLVREIRPAFIFLENVPAIRNRGLDTVAKEISNAGYDCRWTDLSASEVGAWHKRNRWWLLAHSRCNSEREPQGSDVQFEKQTPNGQDSRPVRKNLSDSNGSGLQKARSEQQAEGIKQYREFPNSDCERLPDSLRSRYESKHSEPSDHSLSNWWSTEPDVGRVVNGLPCRVDRIKGLGNAVVPLQAKKAFEKLLGIETKEQNS